MTITDADLRSFIDEELTAEQIDEIRSALVTDRLLTERLERIQKTRSFATGLLDSLGDSDEGQNHRQAWNALETEINRAPVWRSARPAWAALAAGLAITALLFGWPPARATAQRLLGLLRVERVAVLTIDKNMIEGRFSENQFQAFIEAAADNVTTIEPRNEDLEPDTRAEAEEALGYPLRLPTNQLGDPTYRIKIGSGVQFQIDAERFRQVLDAAGVLDIEIPQYLDGVTVHADLPDLAGAGYGPCEDEDRDRQKCLILAQGHSPTVITSPQADLGELAEIGLRLAGHSDPESRRIRESIDWTSTLVLPALNRNAIYEEIDVDGVRGILQTETSSRHGERYWIVWVKHGMTYLVSGSGSSFAGRQLADSLE